MGPILNSSAPEYAPSISNDGNYLIFTSRRADTKGVVVLITIMIISIFQIYIFHNGTKTQKHGLNQLTILGKLIQNTMTVR